MLKENLHQLTIKYGFRVIQWLEKRMAKTSKLSIQEYYDPYLLPWVQELEGQWQLMQAEFGLFVRISATMA